MKKLFASVMAAAVFAASSVTAFAGAPVLFENSAGIINTGGEGRGLMIAAGAVGVLALAGIIFFFVSGKRR